VRAGVGGDANNRTGACIDVDGLGLGLELDWTRRRCVTPREKLKIGRGGLPSQATVFTAAVRMPDACCLNTYIYRGMSGGRIDARTLGKYTLL
jgi:hypothetical protein